MARDARRAAQARADQIRAFRRELRSLADEDAFRPSPEEEAALTAYHDRVLASLARDFDIDRSEREGQLSRGLRIASLLGAAALVAALTALVNQVWGRLGLPAQVTLLTFFPLAALAGVQFAAERERTRYVAGLFALVALGTAWFAMGTIARLLNLPLSPLLFWPAAAFGIAVAVSYGFRLVFALSLAVSVVATASVFFAGGGVPWPVLFDRLEPFTGAAFALLVLSRHVAPLGDGFDDTARHTGLVLLLGALLVLANVFGVSLLAFSSDTAQIVYQIVFVAAAIALLWRALRTSDPRGATIVAVALALFILVRYVDWFWGWIPAWVFFMVLAGMAFASIALLRRVRRRTEAEAI
jgi:hypothetical protein